MKYSQHFMKHWRILSKIIQKSGHKMDLYPAIMAIWFGYFVTITATELINISESVKFISNERKPHDITEKFNLDIFEVASVNIFSSSEDFQRNSLTMMQLFLVIYTARNIYIW